MMLTVLRPSYFHPTNECARAQVADITVLAETQQFTKQESIHRTAIKIYTGKTWLSVPVLRSAHFGQSIQSARIDVHQPWKTSHLRSLEINYRNSAFFFWYSDTVFEVIRSAGDELNGLLWACSRFVFSALHFQTQLIGSSTLPSAIADRTDRALAWLEACKCDTYLVSPEDAGLIDADRLKKNKIALKIYRCRPGPYHQQYGDFVPGLSILDLLFNEGPESLQIIKKFQEIRQPV